MSWVRADFHGFLANSRSIGDENGEICTGQVIL